MKLSNIGQEAEDCLTMEKCGKDVTWLTHYQAVKCGDLETVRKAEDKDFRVTLTMDKSAIELAALYGHTEMLNYFLQKVDKKEDSALLVRVLGDGLRGGHLNIVRKLVDLVQFDESMPVDLYMAAFAGGSVECLKIVNNCTTPISKLKNLYMQDIFYNAGSAQMLKFMMKTLRVDDAQIVAPMIGVPTCFVNVALNQIEPLQKEMKKNGNWYRRRGLLTPMDVAAIFGQLDALKMMVDRMYQEQIIYFNNNMTSTITYALRKNRINILEYLLEYGIAKPNQPCEYPGYEINEAFFYLKEVRGDIKIGDHKVFAENVIDGLKVITAFPDLDKTSPFGEDGKEKYWTESTAASKLTKIKEFYEYLVEMWERGKEVEKPNFDVLFIRALSAQNVDAALALQRLTRGLNCSNENFHQYIVKIFLNAREFGFVPSPVVLELLLNVVMKGEMTCSCDKKASALDMFESYAIVTSDTKNSCYGGIFRYEQKLPLKLLVARAEAALAVLLDYGYRKPRSNRMWDILQFYSDMPSSLLLGGAHVLCLLQCCTIDDENLSALELNYRYKWFDHKWQERNAFLTEFFIAISRNGWTSMTFKGRLSFRKIWLYCCLPENRRKHFLNCLKKVGLSLFDEWLEDAMENGRGDEYDVFHVEHYPDNPPPYLPSLQECARSTIQKHSLCVASSRSAHISANKIIDRLCEALPKRLRLFLQYDDIYGTLFVDDGECADAYLAAEPELANFHVNMNPEIFNSWYNDWCGQGLNLI